MRIEGVVGLSVDRRVPAGTDDSGESELAARGRGPRRGRILVMDDDRWVRDTMLRQLVILGYEVVTAVDGREAVEAYRQARDVGQAFDVVILDLQIPAGMGGEKTLAALTDLNPAVRALVCSGSLSGPVDAYEKQGFCGVLGKPFAMGELRAAVEAAMPRAS